MTATPSEPADRAGAGVERRLHPLSWLFVLLQQLKSFAVPLVILLVTGRGNSFEFYGLYGVVVLVAVSVARYFTYRFRLDADGIVIRSGMFQTVLRDIPYDRIQNVSTHQSLLHRLFGVAVLRLESASGAHAEAEMRVLSVADAQALETFIRQRGVLRSPGGAAGTAPESTDETEAIVSVPLLALSTAEVIRLGLISNRGMVLVAAAFGAMWQFLPEPWLSGQTFRSAFGFLTSEAEALFPRRLPGVVEVAITGILLVVSVIVVVRLLSVLLALLQYHGFTLREVGRQLRVERGLLTRIRAHLPRRRIQAWRLTETPLHRWFRRQTLRVDNAGGAGQEQQSVRDLAPLASPSTMEQLIRHVLRTDDWPPPAWRHLHPRAWRRLIVFPSLLSLGIGAAVTWELGPWGLSALVALPLIVARARVWARYAGYAETGALIAVRVGWLNRSWTFAEVRKLQSLQITVSPFDRRHDMATLWLDTAGASTRDGVLRIPYLPSIEARALFERLSAGLDRRDQIVPSTDGRP